LRFAYLAIGNLVQNKRTLISSLKFVVQQRLKISHNDAIEMHLKSESSDLLLATFISGMKARGCIGREISIYFYLW